MASSGSDGGMGAAAAGVIAAIVAIIAVVFLDWNIFVGAVVFLVVFLIMYFLDEIVTGERGENRDEPKRIARRNAHPNPMAASYTHHEQDAHQDRPEHRFNNPLVEPDDPDPGTPTDSESQ